MQCWEKIYKDDFFFFRNKLETLSNKLVNFGQKPITFWYFLRKRLFVTEYTPHPLEVIQDPLICYCLAKRSRWSFSSLFSHWSLASVSPLIGVVLTGSVRFALMELIVHLTSFKSTGLLDKTDCLNCTFLADKQRWNSLLQFLREPFYSRWTFLYIQSSQVNKRLLVC